MQGLASGERGEPNCNNRTPRLRYDNAVFVFGSNAMADKNKKRFDLGKSGSITCHLSEDAKRLLIEFDTDKDGLDKTGVNGLIDALKRIREKMVR
jgi:hypothetical protein